MPTSTHLRKHVTDRHGSNVNCKDCDKSFNRSGYKQHRTGKSLSEALIFASTNPKYDDRLFIDLPVQYMKIPSSEQGVNMLCIQHVLNMF